MNRAESICGCRACGNYCLVVEPLRAFGPGEFVPYSDGFLGGWPGVQTEVVTCPHCSLVMSWRKNCSSAELLRQRGDLERFHLPPAVWGPAPAYWSGFKQYDRIFHPEDEAAGDDGALPRLGAPPDASELWALRKRAALALGLLWLDNDRDRSEHFFGGTPPRARDEQAARRRPRLLRALIESAQFGEEPTEAGMLQLAEWHRELGDWEAAGALLEGPFEDRFLADRARQLRELVSAQETRVIRFEVGEVLREELGREQLAALRPAEPTPASAAPEPSEAPPAAAAEEGKSPRALLGTLLEVLGTMPAEILTRKYIPRPHGALLRSLVKSHGWDEDSFAVSVIRGFARAHGWPADADREALELLVAFEVDEAQVDYLAAGFKRASWDEWAFDVPTTPAPKTARR